MNPSNCSNTSARGVRGITVVLAFAIASTVCHGTAIAEWPPAPPLEHPDQSDVALLPPSITAEPTGDGMWSVTFRYKSDDPIQTAALAGGFNGWNREAEPMTGPDSIGAWSCTTLLGPGRYEYKFVVNGNRWLQDPLNPEGADDNHEGLNSVFTLGRLAAMSESPAKRGDDDINAVGLLHIPKLPMYFQAVGPRQAQFRLRTLAHDVDSVYVVIKDGAQVEMHVALEDQLFDTWEALVTLPDAAPDNITYTFVLEDGAKRASSPDVYDASLSQTRVFEAPAWAANAIWYQIMPDRFRNGTTENDPDPVHPWTSEWFTQLPYEQRNDWTFYKYAVFFREYGGDLQGVEQKLDYLKALGINAIYFNPVFEAPGHHKYNARTYMHVDEHLGVVGDYADAVAREDLTDPSTWVWTGSDKVFLHFIKTAHENGIRVIIDGVFNHVGNEHPAFVDVQKNGKNSKYADWFDIVSWEPFKYRGWAGVDTLPVFKKSADGLACEGVKQHIFNITRRWMDPDGDGDPSDGIDGWRLDVPNEIAMPFWAEWRDVVKSVNPEAYITGEIWDQADSWLDGRHFDAVMNYQFARAAIAWIINHKQKITPSEIDRRLAHLRLAYPTAATYVLQNLVDSHDTDRIASMALNPDRAYDSQNRVQDSNPAYNNAKPEPDEYRRVRLIALLQMTYVGAPMVYYGDEVGMWGADDPTCRKPMIWEDLQPYDQPDENYVMKEQLDFYRSVIALRNAHSSLRTGEFETLLTDDQKDVWAFARFDDTEHLIVVLNASNEPQEVAVPQPDEAPHEWKVLFGDAGALTDAGAALMKVRVPAVGGVVIGANHQ